MKIESLCEIHFYQKSEDLIFLKIIFTCLVCEINERNHQFQYSALDVIQVAAESTLATLFKYDIKTMTHHSHVILTVRDTQLMMNIAKTLKSEYFENAAALQC
ncbi:uncharacterized protein BDCG_07929 [Blastomyces dermatitidis ER-3]|uniref:Histone H3 n=1 Tax=Ajellomyces dermatitidis (strain ER-3 / ATCC MYA-2586) TaxID=559297 RepID=A0ABP2ENL9_AJEDR|nr:uncharacterized protein BDCG_07929 [Blastomyces dermatitidis ER-3]EEQ84660.2 hypothetical protein BDCG_07929 [Blastomyces dermatitidis ER-3]